MRRSRRSGPRILAIDTSVLIAFLVEDDEHHKRAVSDLSSVDLLLVPAEAVVEAALYLRHHGLSFKPLLDFLRSQDVLILDTKGDDLVEALEKTEDDKKHFVDYLIYRAAASQGVEFLTYDERFARKYLGKN